VIAAIVLAAGASTRFGAQKLLAPLHGKPVVRWAAERALAAGADETIVVTGADGEAVGAALDGLPLRVVRNPRYAEGMSTSLAAGIAAAAAGTRAALLALGDQPLVPAAAYAAVLAEHLVRGAPIVVPVYNGVRGHPVLFDAALFPELAAVRGDQGARDVIARDPARVALVLLALSPPLDVDEPGALAALAT
jgi:molybdenum cofactor cytidylyltransferase